MTTPVANKNRTGLMGAEHVRDLAKIAGEYASTTAVTSAVAAEATLRGNGDADLTNQIAAARRRAIAMAVAL